MSEPEGDALRVLSLDQCADQYVLALGEGHELALSPRADDPDSWLRAKASGHRMLRPTLESVVAYGPDVVVRYWGGDARLLAQLERQGVTVVTIADAADFASVEQSIAEVAQALASRATSAHRSSPADRRRSTPTDAATSARRLAPAIHGP